MTFNDFVQKYDLKNKAKSKIKIYQILCSVGLNKVGLILRDAMFEFNKRVVKLQPKKGTQWVLYINKIILIHMVVLFLENRKLSKFIIKRNGCCLYCEYKIQGLTHKRDSYCAAYC